MCFLIYISHQWGAWCFRKDAAALFLLQEEWPKHRKARWLTKSSTSHSVPRLCVTISVKGWFLFKTGKVVRHKRSLWVSVLDCLGEEHVGRQLVVSPCCGPGCSLALSKADRGMWSPRGCPWEMPVFHFTSSPHPGAQLPIHRPPAHLPAHHLSLPLSMGELSSLGGCSWGPCSSPCLLDRGSGLPCSAAARLAVLSCRSLLPKIAEHIFFPRPPHSSMHTPLENRFFCNKCAMHGYAHMIFILLFVVAVFVKIRRIGRKKENFHLKLYFACMEGALQIKMC